MQNAEHVENYRLLNCFASVRLQRINAGIKKQSAKSHANGEAKPALTKPKCGTIKTPMSTRAIISNTPEKIANRENPMP